MATEWVERNAVVIAMVEFAALVVGGLASTIGYLFNRGRLRNMQEEAEKAEVLAKDRQKVLVSLIKGIADKPEAKRYKEAWLRSPGAGRNAAKAIIAAPTLEEVREIWGAFFAAQRRTDTNWAFWAYAIRLEEAGLGDEITDLTFELYSGDEDIDPTEEVEATIKEWRDAR